MPDLWTVILVLLIAGAIGDEFAKRAERRTDVARLVGEKSGPGQPSNELPDGVREYLARLDAQLRLPAAVRREIDLELRDHFLDSIAGLEAEGLDRDRATREAMARLGRPEELGRQLRVAHQSNLRLLAGVGGGVFSAASGALYGLVLGYLLAMIAIFVGAAVLALTIGRFVGPLSNDEIAFGTVFGCLVAYVPAVLSARRAVAASAAISQRDPRSLARFWAIGGAVAITALLLFVVTAQQSWIALVFEAAIPVAFALGALVRPTWRIPRIRGRIFVPAAVAIVVVPIVLGLLLVSESSTSVETIDGPLPQVDQHLDVIAPQTVETAHIVAGFGGWVGRSAMDLQTHVDDPSYFANWRDLRLEAWRAAPASGNRPEDVQGVVDTRFHAPYASVPIPSITEDLVVHVDLGHCRTTRWMIVATGTGPDGKRYLLTPSIGVIDSQFSGTAWDWLTAKD